jgi:hypothetical protein
MSTIYVEIYVDIYVELYVETFMSKDLCRMSKDLCRTIKRVKPRTGEAVRAHPPVSFT